MASRWPSLILALCAAALSAFVAHALFGLGGAGLDTFFNIWVYDGLIFVSVLLYVARGIMVREDRWVWLVLGAGLLSSFGGELYWSLELDGTPPYPSPADAL